MLIGCVNIEQQDESSQPANPFFKIKPVRRICAAAIRREREKDNSSSQSQRYCYCKNPQRPFSPLYLTVSDLHRRSRVVVICFIANKSWGSNYWYTMFTPSPASVVRWHHCSESPSKREVQEGSGVPVCCLSSSQSGVGRISDGRVEFVESKSLPVEEVFLRSRRR